MKSPFESAIATAERKPLFQLRKILLAYDASRAAQQALKGAGVLAQHFHSELAVARIHSAADAAFDGISDSKREKIGSEQELEEIRAQMNALGVSCRGIVRIGSVGDIIVNLCIEESADLVMFGAYGHGNQDRHTLGSTAEHLLSTLPCPAMVYGPSVREPFVLQEKCGPVLFPVSLPFDLRQTQKAIDIAAFFAAPIEVLYVRPPFSPADLTEVESECQKIASRFRNAGIRVSSSVILGNPAESIVKRAAELRSSFVLMPIQYHHVMALDRVAAGVVRLSEVPVLTYGMK